MGIIVDETREMVNSSIKTGEIVDETREMVDSSTKTGKIVDETGKEVEERGIGIAREEFYESKIIISYICRLYEARLV